jgi:serine/threonine protein kinase
MLIAAEGPLAPQRHVIPSQGLTIGRHPDNDLVLTDELMVSRFHSAIAIEDGRYTLYDRDSANGTWVNDQRIFRHVLTPGDRIQIWNSRLIFSLSDSPPPPPPPPARPQPTIHTVGEQFCGYRLENVIGRGGMSEVYKARDPQGRSVAIKILLERDPYLVTKFIQEGNQIGPLLRGHANIVYVHEFGRSPDNRLYIVMEYLEAPSLRRVLKGPLGEQETVRILAMVCDALAFAHQHHIVHRDIKPENVLVLPDGGVKVLDFGIAKLTSASTITQGKIVGTPEYLSPEQARGEPVLPASDVYSLGIVLYEMLTGTVPFPRSHSGEPYRAAMEVIRQHLREKPVAMHVRNPEITVSPRLERIAMRALSKDLKHRYTTARELGRALGYLQPLSGHLDTDRMPPASLVVTQGPEQGHRIQLSDQCLALGRLELGSSNAMISRHHANVVYRGGTYWLEDLSKNGTWVDNQRIYGEVPLTSRSVVVIGDVVLRLEQAST